MDLKEYNIGVCEKFGLYTHTPDLCILYFLYIFLWIAILEKWGNMVYKNTEKIWREHGNNMEEI